MAAVAAGAWYWSQRGAERRRRRLPHRRRSSAATSASRSRPPARSAPISTVDRRQPDLRAGDRGAGRLQRPGGEGPGDRAHRSRAPTRRRSRKGSAQIASARAALDQAQATLRNAELDYQRKAELGERQLVARSDVDLARAARDQARAQVASAQAQIAQQTASTQTTRINLDRTVIRSPVDGVVLTRTIEPGQTVAASLQAPELFTDRRGPVAR